MKKINRREKIILVASLGHLVGNLKTACTMIYVWVGKKEAKKFDKLINDATELINEAIKKIKNIKEYDY